MAALSATAFGAGFLVERQLMMPWRRLALRQSEVLHGPGLIRTNFQAGEGDDAARSQIGARR